MLDFFALSLADLQAWLQQQGYPAFQAEQIFSWVYSKGVRQWDAMTNLSAPLRTELARSYRLTSASLLKVTDGPGIFRFQWLLIDRSRVETILRSDKEGWTYLVSTQVGCPVGCSFCASGKRGFVRNLQAAEILDAFFQARAWLREHKGKELSSVAFDAMGEPLKNLKALSETIRHLCDPRIGGLRPRQLLVSTAGLVEGIEQLLKLGMPIPLKVGLHAPNQKLRQSLVPYAKKNRMEELMAVCRRYAMQSGQPVTFDYVMLAGINDHADQAFELANLVKNLRCQIRLIPYHRVGGLPYAPPSKKQIKDFRTVLFGSKVVNTLLEERGSDEGMALGQLMVLPAKSEEAAP